MTFEPILPSHFDSTMLTAFRACPQKFYLEFTRGVRPRAKSIDLHAGGCFAKAIETVYKRAHAGEPIPIALAAAELTFYQMWGDFEVIDEKHVKQRDHMWDAVVDYVRTYGVLTDRIQPYKLNGEATYEFSFAIPMDMPGWPLHPVTNDPFIFVGRFDQLGVLDGTVPIVRDDKTSSRGGATWAKQWDLRGQFLGYLWACQTNNIPANNVCIRGTIIHKDEFVQLQAIKTYSNVLIAKWLEQTRRDLTRLVACWNDGYFDLNLGDSCHSYTGCMFKDMCESPDPERWLPSFVENRWNPLQLDPLDPDLVPPTLPEPTR